MTVVLPTVVAVLCREESKTPITDPSPRAYETGTEHSPTDDKAMTEIDNTAVAALGAAIETLVPTG